MRNSANRGTKRQRNQISGNKATGRKSLGNLQENKLAWLEEAKLSTNSVIKRSLLSILMIGIMVILF